VQVGSLREEQAADALRGIDLTLLGQSGIVPASLLELPSVGTLNAHPGALPAYRGLDASLWALSDDDFEHVESTLHLVDPGIDTGAVVLRHPYEWRGDETLHNLEERLYEDCIDLLLRGVELAGRGELHGEAQGQGVYRGVVSRRQRRSAEQKLGAFLVRRSRTL
jgi:methionyl-tRNA formyltransferase